MDFLNFIDFKITDVLDIIFVAVLLYYIYKLVRGSVAINIFIGIVIVWAFWKLTELLDMQMISSMVGAFMQVGLIALIIVFQQENHQKRFKYWFGAFWGASLGRLHLDHLVCTSVLMQRGARFFF